MTYNKIINDTLKNIEEKENNLKQIRVRIDIKNHKNEQKTLIKVINIK